MSATFSGTDPCTPRLGLPLLSPGQSLKYITHNGALMELDKRVRHLGEGGLPSLCHNGRFSVWQRGHYFTETGANDRLAFAADRWAVSLLGNNANRAERRDTVFGPGLGLFRNTGTVVEIGRQNIVQALPTEVSRGMAGQRVVLSWQLKPGEGLSASSVRVCLFSGQGEDEGVSALLAGQWSGQRVLAEGSFSTADAVAVRNYVTAEVPTVDESFSQIGIVIHWESDVEAVSAEDGLCLIDVRLQIGDTPAICARIDPAMEQANCERFYQDRGLPNGTSASAGITQHYEVFTAIGSSALRTFLPLKRSMRRIPDIDLLRGAFAEGADAPWNVYNSDWMSGETMTIEQNRHDGFVTQITLPSNTLSPGLGYLCNGGWTADAEMY